jgi:hypothetical protein
MHPMKVKSICLIVLTAAVGACGGGGTASPRSSPPLSTVPSDRAPFIARADRICSELHRDQADLGSQLRSGKESEAGYYRKLGGFVRTSVANLRSLEPPARDRRLIDAYLNLVGGNAPLLEELARATERGDQAETDRLLDRVRDIGRRGRTLARAYGFKVCGS